MKKMLFISGIVLLAYACSKTSEDAQDPNPPNPPGGNPCDTVNMKYAANIVPILSSNCYHCHGTTTNTGSGGIILEGYGNLKVRADNGRLLGAITHAAGFPAMPKDAGKLSDCNINKIRSWINNGTQNN